jgi:toxin ParE1/3/4
MRFWLHEAADAELDAAVADYESCRPGLGIDFAEEVYAAIALARAYSQASLALSENTRRRLVKRFPFGIIYQTKSDALYVIAVAGLRRRPGYWQDRKIG